MKKFRMRKIWQVLGAAACLMIGSAIAANADTTVLSADKESVSGCTTLGIDGKYVSQPAEALARINQIRLEACQEGVVNPATGKALTTSDYSPLEWSADMEYIARIRAAEASLTLDHVRADDSSCFDIQSPNGQLSYSEVLAWTWDESMLTAIEFWYAEKAQYVAASGVGSALEIGHYGSMINPNYHYVGLASFCSDSVAFYNTTCGQFSKYAGTSSTPMETYASCTQLVNVKDHYITSNSDGLAVVTVDGSQASGLMVASDAVVMSAEREEAVENTAAAGLPASWNSGDAVFALKADYAVYMEYTGKGGSVVIPERIIVNGVKLPVTEIAPNAFRNKSGKKVTSLRIGKNVTTIGAGAFSGCKKLKKIKIQSTGITNIGSGAFKKVPKKPESTFPVQ